MEFGVKKEGNFNQSAGYSRIQGSIREDEYRNPSGLGSFFALMLTTLCDSHLNFRQWDLPVLNYSSERSVRHSGIFHSMIVGLSLASSDPTVPSSSAHFQK